MSEGHVGRLLLPSILMFEERDNGLYASGKLLPFLLEELIARGMSEIVVADRWRYEQILPDLPRIFSKALHFADDTEDRILSSKIFLPFFEEVGIEPGKNLESFKINKPRRPEDEEAIDASLVACTNLPLFLTAMRQKSHCHLDMTSMLTHFDRVLTCTRSPEMRANIAVLKGIFSNYQEAAYGSLKPQANTAEGMIVLFEELVENAKYKSLSREVALLGSSKIAIATTTNKITRMAKEIVQSKVAKGVLDFGSTVITAYTGVPIPKSDLAETLVKEKYFPPVVDISPYIESAKIKMFNAYPESNFLPRPPKEPQV